MKEISRSLEFVCQLFHHSKRCEQNCESKTTDKRHFLNYNIKKSSLSSHRIWHLYSANIKLLSFFFKFYTITFYKYS